VESAQSVPASLCGRSSLRNPDWTESVSRPQRVQRPRTFLPDWGGCVRRKMLIAFRIRFVFHGLLGLHSPAYRVVLETDHDVPEPALNKMRSFEAFFFAHKNMKCVELILQDHVLLRRGMDIIDGMLKHLEDGQRIEIADVATVLKFLRLFGDQYHQAMEEGVLFPALLDAAPDETALLHLVSEHGNERTLVIEIEGTLISRRGMAFFRSARQLTAMLRHHCDKEEAIIRGLAEHYLSKDKDEAILAEFMKSRPQSEIYVNFSRLERKYLSKPAPEHVGPTGEFARVRGAQY
jgi:hemerythrin-like domain-containing protein